MENWHFENIKYLWGSLALPIFALIFTIRMIYQKKQITKLGNHRLIAMHMPERSPNRNILKFIVFSIAYIFLIVALANPQVGSKLEKVKVKGAEIMIALDVSNSMKAEDISPNRLEKARQEIMQLLSRTKGDRIGLAVFAGKAFVPVPLTNDYAMIKMYLRGIDTDVISTQGTNIGAAIRQSEEAFTDKSSKSKAIIIITDGENHEEDAIKAAEEAAKKGIVIHTIGLGNEKGVPLPLVNQWGQKEYRKDNEGNVVVSKLNQDLLNEIAKIGKGQFVKASNQGLGLENIYKQLTALEKKEFQEKVVLDYEDDFQFYLWFALIFMVIEQIILPRKNKYLAKIKISKVQL